MRFAILIFLSILFFCAAMKGTARFVAFGFDWTDILPRITFGHGRGWATASRRDYGALKESAISAVSLANAELERWFPEKRDHDREMEAVRAEITKRVKELK